ncbi:hypothetical protein GCM10020367_62230 [Streptomyces sannanensis]|uniref:Uncharacterized protein n=1 Tax=Streptomyces sannanensis TaxID=285536 RepID=A0ABP6SKK6_9ACTN
MTGMTDRERAAAQAYVRLLETARAVLTQGPGNAPAMVPLLAAPMADADEALQAAGLAGNEAGYFRLVARLRPEVQQDMDI